MSSCKGEPTRVAISPIKSGSDALKASCKGGVFAIPFSSGVNGLRGKESCKVWRL
jgi:hypothetical protein